MTDPPIDLKNRYLAAFLAWLVPGLGHWYQGRRGKAALYGICILGLYFTGMVLGEFKVAYWRWTTPWADPENFRLSYVGQFWTGLVALPGLIQSALRHYGFGPILWGYMDMPPQHAINALHPRLHKLVEVGNVYTVVAGLLNILAIYDALEGPAFGDEEAPATEKAVVEAGALNAGEIA